MTGISKGTLSKIEVDFRNALNRKWKVYDDVPVD